MSLSRVLLADLSPLLEDMVASILSQSGDFEIIKKKLGPRRLFEVVSKTNTSVAVVAQSEPDNVADIDFHFAKAMNTAVIALSLDGASATVHSFHSKMEHLKNVSTQQIVAALVNARMPLANVIHETSHYN